MTKIDAETLAEFHKEHRNTKRDISECERELVSLTRYLGWLEVQLSEMDS